MSKTGNLAFITFSASGWTGRIRSIEGFVENGVVLDNDDLSSTGHMKYCPGDLIGHDAIPVEIYFDQANPPPLQQTIETITITFPLHGAVNPSILSGTAWHSQRTGPQLLNNQLLIGGFSIKYDGETGPAYSTP